MADQDLTGGHAAGIARGAAVIAGLTVLSRILGLVRTLVFSQRVGASCLGTAYITANQVPNLVYELVVGGALTSAMIPVLARSAERAADDPQERARVSQISSALLTWSVVLLLPLTVVVAAASGPIADLLNPANANAHCNRADVVAVTSSMLTVFSPQILLSGLSVVLYGLLQAYRRFAAPALGPAISSLVVISAYLAFAPVDRDLPLSRLPLSAELILSVGTTLGVAALVADEFNSLFLRNSINFGMPAVTIPGVSGAIRDQDRVRLNVRAATIENVLDGTMLTGTPLPDFVLEIVARGGLLPKLVADGYLLADPTAAGGSAKAATRNSGER